MSTSSWKLVTITVSLAMCVAAEGRAQTPPAHAQPQPQTREQQQPQRRARPALPTRRFNGRMFSRRAWWKLPNLVKQLGVTEEQAKKLDDMAASQEQEMTQLRTTIDRANADLMSELDKETVDGKAVARQRAALEKARQRIAQLNLEKIVATRNILTYQQWHTLREISPRAVEGQDGMTPKAYRERFQRSPTRQ